MLNVKRYDCGLYTQKHKERCWEDAEHHTEEKGEEDDVM